MKAAGAGAVQGVSLDGAVALVTGASSGIGQATARALSARGARVGLLARRSAALEALAAELRDAGGTVATGPLDVTDMAAVPVAVDGLVHELGGLDILVNNAGVMLAGAALQAPFAEWQRSVQVNVLGLLACTHAALGHLARTAAIRDVADLVNVGSIVSRAPRAQLAVYSATKAAGAAYSEALRQEMAPLGVRVCQITPGSTATELRMHNRPEVRRELESAGVRRLDPGDVAAAVLFAVSRPPGVSIDEIVVRPTGQI